MAKLTRPTETKIFGSTALAAELTPFGSSTPSTDINLILNSTEAERGWGTIGANGFPPMEWFNALGYGLSYYNAYLMQQGIPEWTALQNYYINSYAVGSDGKLYRSKIGISGTPNAGNNPTTDTTNVNWVESIKADLPAVINGATAKTVPIGADKLGIYDSISGLLRSVSFTDFWASLSGLFAPIASPIFSGSISAKNAMYKDTPVTVTSWSYETTTITLNVASRPFIAGDYIEVGGLTATTNIPNGVHLVTSVTATTIVFTYALTPTGATGVSSATVKGYMTTNGGVDGIGVGQTLQNVTGSRALGTTYTNTTGKPIYVSLAIIPSVIVNFVINGVTVGTSSNDSRYQYLGGIVPNGGTYGTVSGTATLGTWAELR